MTLETLIFLRDICNRISIPVADPDFRKMSLSMISALDELDKEINEASISSSLAENYANNSE